MVTWTLDIMRTTMILILNVSFLINTYDVLLIKGAGRGSKVDFHFFVVSDRGEFQPSEKFFGMKNIVPCQSNRILKSQKYIKSHCVCGL